MHCPLQAWIHALSWTIHGLPAPSMDPCFVLDNPWIARSKHGSMLCPGQSMDGPLHMLCPGGPLQAWIHALSWTIHGCLDKHKCILSNYSFIARFVCFILFCCYCFRDFVASRKHFTSLLGGKWNLLSDIN